AAPSPPARPSPLSRSEPALPRTAPAGNNRGTPGGWRSKRVLPLSSGQPSAKFASTSQPLRSSTKMDCSVEVWGEMSHSSIHIRSDRHRPIGAARASGKARQAGRPVPPVRAGLALACAIWLAGGSVVPPLRAASKGRGAFKDGRKAELNKDYDKALELYERAQRDEPDNQNYTLAVRRIRFVAGQNHVDQGHRLLDQGQLQEAAAEFEKAVTIDPASAIAEQELRRTQDLLKRQRQKPAGAKPPAPGSAEEASESGTSPILAAKKQTEALLESAQPIPQLK